MVVKRLVRTYIWPENIMASGLPRVALCLLGGIVGGVACAAVLGLVALLASGSVQARVRDFVNRNFFSYRYDYRQEWLRFISVFSDSLTETTSA